MLRIRDWIYVKSLVRLQSGSWRWQDKYAVSVYGVRRARDGRLLLFRVNQYGPYASVGRDRRRPVVESDYIGTKHNRPLDADSIQKIKSRMRSRGFPRNKMNRLEHLCKLLIPGVSEAMS